MDEGSHDDGCLVLTEEHRMLLRMRETLYEGSWEDFILDLRARFDGRPHVFETLPDSPGMKPTISRHLDLIAQMQRWEADRGRTLRCDDEL